MATMLNDLKLFLMLPIYLEYANLLPLFPLKSISNQI